QKTYVDTIRTHDMVFGNGPAGTGKSFLAVAMAVSALMKREVARIVLTRPAVEAGERLGFLPGDLYEKVHPYLRPLYDALYDMLEAEKVAALMEKGAIEIAPLAYMRGRTLNDAFIILDEAQNSTTEQMKMFLTRLGFNSKMVITGDITQVDLPSSRGSGLIGVQSILRGVPGIGFVYFNEHDVVRHRLVSAIIRAYGEHEARTAAARAPAERSAPAPDDGTTAGAG
ncbi:MAG TPA: PhoH family protein, partial [Methylomirabilota bacterium]|nr:PhoH family protein [Methylomirabilota bacterium]